MAVLLVVLILSVVQSLFGMGLLVFGTPTLILMGYEFTEVLSILLPPSVIISALQLLYLGERDHSFTKNFSLYCLPPTILFLVIHVLMNTKINIDVMLAVVLFISACCRIYPLVLRRLRQFLEHYSRTYLILMGCVHGLSNMGGTLLSVYAGSLYKDKSDTLGVIATGYFIFGLVQLLTLMLLGQEFSFNGMLINCVIAAVICLLVRQFVYGSLSNRQYQTIFTIFMFGYSFLLVSKGSL